MIDPICPKCHGDLKGFATRDHDVAFFCVNPNCPYYAGIPDPDMPKEEGLDHSDEIADRDRLISQYEDENRETEADKLGMLKEQEGYE